MQGQALFFNGIGLVSAPLDIKVGINLFTDDMGRLLIGEVAKRTGLSAPTIRYYEEIGLIGKTRRSASGYRQYPPEIVDQLRFVELAQGLGLSLDELRPLIGLISSRTRPPASLLRYGQQHLALAQKRILELKGFRRKLRRMFGAISARLE